DEREAVGRAAVRDVAHARGVRRRALLAGLRLDRSVAVVVELVAQLVRGDDLTRARAPLDAADARAGAGLADADVHGAGRAVITALRIARIADARPVRDGVALA